MPQVSHGQDQTHEKPYSFKDRPWPKAEVTFRLGAKRPTDASSVKGQIYDIASRFPEGVKGETLATLVQNKVRTPRSHHASDGKPDLEWVQRYISGMTRRKFDFLRISEQVAEEQDNSEL